MTVTLKFQSTGSIPGNGDPVVMRGPSLTIGRGAENDLALPDPDRSLSRRHCAIEDHNGNIVAVDLSVNGTFLNYGKLALGATPTPLNDGDILSVGPYEILVSIAAAGRAEDLIADPLADGPVSHGLAERAPSAADLLDAPGDGGDFLDDLLSGRDGPVGPAGVQREDLGEDGLLPPLEDEGSILPPAEDPFAGQGASTASHAPASQEFFSAPQSSASGSAIPDDWDDDFLSPSGGSSARPDATDPFASPQPSSGGNAAFIPDDFGADDDLGLGPLPQADSAPPVQPAAIPEPAPEPVPEPSPEPAPIAEVMPDPAPVAPAEPAPEPAARPEPQPVVQPAGNASGGNDEAAQAFLRALGAGDVPLRPEELTATMARMGHVMRILVEGTREILMTRTSIKSEFRIEQTMIQAGGNNPLKFSISPEQAIEAMVKPSAKGYLDATAAAEQALDDIKAHEVAMVTGMNAAIKGILGKLDPVVLEEQLASGGGLGAMLKSRKARYWEIYENMYASISDQAENDFHELFAREFARAYREQLDKLK